MMGARVYRGANVSLLVGVQERERVRVNACDLRLLLQVSDPSYERGLVLGASWWLFWSRLAPCRTQCSGLSSKMWVQFYYIYYHHLRHDQIIAEKIVHNFQLNVHFTWWMKYHGQDRNPSPFKQYTFIPTIAKSKTCSKCSKLWKICSGRCRMRASKQSWRAVNNFLVVQIVDYYYFFWFMLYTWKF